MTTLNVTLKTIEAIEVKTSYNTNTKCKGFCIVNGQTKSFTAHQEYQGYQLPDKIVINIDNINKAQLITLGIELNVSELETAFIELKKKTEEAAQIKLVADRITNATAAYKNSPLQWYQKTYTDWKISFTEEQYIQIAKDGRVYQSTLRLELGNAKIYYNDKGQYELNFNSDVIKRSKVAERVEDAYQAHVKSLAIGEQRAAAEKKAKEERITNERKLLGSMKTKQILESHSYGHGRTYRHSTTQHHEYMIEENKESSYKSKLIHFNFVDDDNNIEVRKWQIGKLTIKQLKAITEIIKNG